MNAVGRTVGMMCGALLSSAGAHAQVEPAWVQLAPEGSTVEGPGPQIIYGGSQYPYRDNGTDGARDLSRAIYAVEWREGLELMHPPGDPWYVSEGNILEFKLAPARGYVAVREDQGPGEAGGARLAILDPGGEVIDTVDAVRKFVWSPTGDEIAYITGAAYEGGRGFVSTGAGIVDMERLETRDIYPEGWDLRWASEDRGLYIQVRDSEGPRVVRYEPTTREVEHTARHGIYFSPGGQYYFDPARGGRPFRLFETGRDEELTAWESSTGPVETDDEAFFRSWEVRYAQPRGWWDWNTLVVPGQVGAGPVREYLYNVEDGSCALVEGVVLGEAGPEYGCFESGQWKCGCGVK